MWYHVFLWSLFSSFILHVIASMVAFASLRRHKIARYGPILILLSSVITPLLSYTITSAVIACVYRAATFNMYPLHAMFWGCGLTLCTSFFSFSNILATLWSSFRNLLSLSLHSPTHSLTTIHRIPLLSKVIFFQLKNHKSLTSRESAFLIIIIVIFIYF